MSIVTLVLMGGVLVVLAAGVGVMACRSGAKGADLSTALMAARVGLQALAVGSLFVVAALK
jgi:hypothetical protein